MRTILHILTRPADELTSEVMGQQRNIPETTLQLADLTKTDPDYDKLVEMIFSANSVQVW